MIVAPMFRVGPISPPPTPIGADRFTDADELPRPAASDRNTLFDPSVFDRGIAACSGE